MSFFLACTKHQVGSWRYTHSGGRNTRVKSTRSKLLPQLHSEFQNSLDYQVSKSKRHEWRVGVKDDINVNGLGDPHPQLSRDLWS